MNWDKGYSASYYATVVDTTTWRDTERFEITGGSVKREADGLMQSCDIDCVGYPEGIEQYVRVYMDTKQEGDAEHVALFTGLATSPDRETEATLVTNKVACYSVLKPCEDVMLQRGWYAPAGANGADIVEKLLSVSPAPVERDEVDAPSLTQSIVSEDGETNLSMAQKVLTAMNWRMLLRGDGTVFLTPIADQPVMVFNPLDNDVIEAPIKVKGDWYGCPNVFMAIDDDLTAIARDEDEDSILSIPARGREVWMHESNCDLADNETIAEYARRRLQEEQRYEVSASYDRRFFPDVNVTDIITLRYPEQNLVGSFYVESQTIELGYGAKVSEEVIKK